MRGLLKALLLVAVAVLALPGTPAQAQEDGGFRGTFVRDEAASDPMERIVSDGMARLSPVYRAPLIRNQVRRRLIETNRPSAWVSFTPEAASITVETDSYRITAPLTGQVERWERSRGEVVEVTTVLAGRRLAQTFEAEDGRRENVYTLSPDGDTLTLRVTVTSNRLSSPLEYRMVFRRR